jgi:hypothetical protein
MAKTGKVLDMDLSVGVVLSASWRADISRNGSRRRLLPGFCDPASTRLTLADDPSIMPTRVEFPTVARMRIKRRTRAAVENSRIAVQHLTKALFLSKPAEPLLNTAGKLK